MRAPSNISAPPGPSAGSLPNVSDRYSNTSLSSTTELTPTSPPRPISSPCNWGLECEVCGQKLMSIKLLEQHCCRHFIRELEDQYSYLIDGLKCTICNTLFKQKRRLLLHIGGKHGKVSDILKQMGYAALPCPVLVKSNSTMQKQLVQIMKEEMKTDVCSSITY